MSLQGTGRGHKVKHTGDGVGVSTQRLLQQPGPKDRQDSFSSCIFLGYNEDFVSLGLPQEKPSVLIGILTQPPHYTDVCD